MNFESIGARKRSDHIRYAQTEELQLIFDVGTARVKKVYARLQNLPLRNSSPDLGMQISCRHHEPHFPHLQCTGLTFRSHLR